MKIILLVLLLLISSPALANDASPAPTVAYCGDLGDLIGGQDMDGKDRPTYCCSGLTAVGGWPGGYQGACDAPAPPTGLRTCVSCGDQKCDIASGENKCNCPSDCQTE